MCIDKISVQAVARVFGNSADITQEEVNYMIIWKNGDVTLERDNITQKYAIFMRVKYPSGTTAFWQQMTKWYSYRKSCEKAYHKLITRNPIYQNIVYIGEE